MTRLFLLITLTINPLPLLAEQTPIEAILAIGPEGKGNTKASEAWGELTTHSDQKTLMMIFDAMNDAGPVASNWLRSAAEVVFKNLEEKQIASSNVLGEYFLNEKNPSKARFFAFELIKRNAPEAVNEIADKQIPGFGEVFRSISLKTVGTSAIQSRACAVLANGKYIFALPGSSGGVTDAWDNILKYQLDKNHKPCNVSYY